MIADCTALILAGGDSRRMGQDKTRIEFEGTSLLQRAIDRMRVVFPHVLVSVRQRRDDIDAPQVCDTVPGAGPLAGLCAGLEAAGTSWVFVMATDMPFPETKLIRRLAQSRGTHQAVVPVVGDMPQPTFAFYARQALPLLKSTLAGSGKRSLLSSLACLEVRWVDEAALVSSDPELRSFIDLDTPQDWSKIRRIGKA